jgi:hypothetical protein
MDPRPKQIFFPKKKAYKWLTGIWNEMYSTSLTTRKVNQNHRKCHLTLAWMTVIHQTDEREVSARTWRKGNLPHLWEWMSIVVAIMQNSMKLPQKIKNAIAIRVSYLTSGFISKRNEIFLLKWYLCPIFIAMLFTRAKKWKQQKGLLIEESIQKTW